MKKVAAFGKYKTIWAAAILLVLVLISTMSTGSLKARFTSSSSGNDAARMAAFVFHVDETEGHFVTQVDIEKPGAICSYEFVITNKEGNVVCETDQKYTITVELEGSLPLVCTLMKNDSATPELSIDALSNPEEVGPLPKEASCSDTFVASVPEEDTYILNIEWPDVDLRKDPKYAGGVAEVEIDIVSVQVD